MELQIVEDRLRKEHGLPDDFVFFAWHALPESGTRIEDFTCTQLTGGQCPLLTRGKRKGKPNYRKITNKRDFIVSNEKAEQWELEYENETGNCRKCRGSTQVPCHWDFVSGTVDYRTCGECNGTGKAKSAAVA